MLHRELFLKKFCSEHLEGLFVATVNVYLTLFLFGYASYEVWLYFGEFI